MKRNEKHRIVSPQTIVSTVVICVLLSTVVHNSLGSLQAHLLARCLFLTPTTFADDASGYWSSHLQDVADDFVSINNNLHTYSDAGVHSTL